MFSTKHYILRAERNFFSIFQIIFSWWPKTNKEIRSARKNATLRRHSSTNFPLLYICPNQHQKLVDTNLKGEETLIRDCKRPNTYISNQVLLISQVKRCTSVMRLAWVQYLTWTFFVVSFEYDDLNHIVCSRCGLLYMNVLFYFVGRLMLIFRQTYPGRWCSLPSL